MGRAAHNFRRRQKLIEKHTGRPYVPRGKGDAKGTDASRQKSWWKDDWWSDTWETEAEAPHRKKKGDSRKAKTPKDIDDKKVGVKKGLKKKNSKSKADPNNEQPKVKKMSKLKKRLEAMKKNKLKAEDVTSGDDPKAKAFKKKKKLASDGHDGEVKKLKKKRVLASDSASAPATRKKKKVVKDIGEVTHEAEEPKPKKISKKALRRERLRERMKQRHSAYIICPGSLTERFARGPLNGNERRLLLSGGLSWRWYREAKTDDELVPLNPNSTTLKAGRILHDADALRPNHQAHSNELWTRQRSLSSRAAEALKYFDRSLESDAAWPPCVARVALASRLQAKGGINRRCTSYLNEVIQPLLVDVPAVSSSTTEESKKIAGLMAEAKGLCLKCARRWSTKECNMNELKSVWSQMLRRALAPPRPQDETDNDDRLNWFRALRAAVLSRLCPRKDDDNQSFLLKSIAAAAADAGVDQKESALMTIPLGVFTFWQALFLVLMAQSLGMSAFVVRRRADGTPQVIFRCGES